ncbi:12260_t:CDS:2, partial [Entrophospora sp. SA101]
FVWSYFQEEDGNDVCKILISIRGKETTCGKRYKHDCSTGNMKQHLQVKHGILESEELQTGLEKYSQPKIDSIFKKVIPHDSSKQKELKRITAVWLITDSLPFNVVNKKGYLKIMKTIDPAFNSPSSKSIKNSLSVAYNKGMEENNESENVDMELKVLHTKQDSQMLEEKWKKVKRKKRYVTRILAADVPGRKNQDKISLFSTNHGEVGV